MATFKRQCNIYIERKRVMGVRSSSYARASAELTDGELYLIAAGGRTEHELQMKVIPPITRATANLIGQRIATSSSPVFHSGVSCFFPAAAWV